MAINRIHNAQKVDYKNSIEISFMQHKFYREVRHKASIFYHQIQLHYFTRT